MARPRKFWRPLLAEYLLTCQGDLPRVIVSSNSSGKIFLLWSGAAHFVPGNPFHGSHGDIRHPFPRSFPVTPGPPFPGYRGRARPAVYPRPASRQPSGKQIENKRGLRKATRRPRVVISVTRRRFGAPAVKSRSCRSDARLCPAGAGTVVRGGSFRGPSPTADHLRAPDEMPAAGRPPTCRVKAVL